MNERDLYTVYDYAQEYHRRLIDISRVEGQLKSLLPRWTDRLLLHLGESMISLGQRLKESSAKAQPADLTQECA